MGFFSKIASGVKKAAVYALDTNLAMFADPVTFITKGRKAAVKKSTSRTGLQNVPRILGTTAVAATAVLLPGTATGRAISLKAAKSVPKVIRAVVPKTTKGKIIAAAVAPVAISAVVRSPKKAVKAPGKIIGAQVALGGLIADPTVEGAGSFIKEHPVITALGVGGLAVVGAKTVAPVAGGLLTSRAVAKAAEKPIVIDIPPSTIAPVAAQVQAPAAQKAIGIEGESPILPETTTVSATKKRSKRRTAKKPMQVRQSVRVNVISGTSNKRYIKLGGYC